MEDDIWTKSTKRELRQMQKYIYDQTHVAVERWAEHHSNIIENMQFSSAAAWKSVKTLSAGQSSHLKQV